MKLTKIQLWDRDGGTLLGEPEILWPPPSGVPDVIFVANRTFGISTAARTPGAVPRYLEVRTMGITGFDFR